MKRDVIKKSILGIIFEITPGENISDINPDKPIKE